MLERVANFLAEESDFVLAVTGLAFTLAGLASRSLGQIRWKGMAWGWLTAYLALQSAEAFVDMLAGGLTDSDNLVLAGKLIMRSVSNVVLLEFCRQGFSRLGYKTPGSWVLLLPVLAVGAGALGGLPTLDTGAFLFLGTPAKILGGLLLLKIGASDKELGKWLSFAGATLLALIIPSLLRIVTLVFEPGLAITPTWMPDSRSLPVDASKALLALMLDYPLWNYARKVRISRLPDSSPREFNVVARNSAMALFFIVAAGWGVSFYVAQASKQDRSIQVANLASASASTFSPELFRSISGSIEDRHNPAWQEIHRHCMGIAESVSGVRYVYALGRRPDSGALFFYADTQPQKHNVPGSVPTAEPGERYDEPDSALFSKVFQLRRSVGFGPYTDKWGTFISSGAPILNEDGSVAAVLGIDIDARDWMTDVWAQRVAPLLLTIVLSLLVALLYNGAQRGMEDQRRISFSEQSLRNVLNHVHDAIVVHDDQGRVIDINKRMLEMFELELAQANQCVVHRDLVAEAGQQQTLQTYWQNVLAGDEALVEWQLRRPLANTTFFGEIYMTRMERSDGPAIIATIRDVTRRRFAEEQLKLAMNRAENLAEKADQANRAKSTFLANMSHEIRTPMNGILGMTSLMADMDLPPQAKEYLDIAHRSGEQLLQILNDILDFSKIEAGRMEVNLSPFDLIATVEDACAMPGIRALSSGLDFACIIDHDVPQSIIGDPVRLRQIIANLLGNAVKFTKNGEVVIRIALAAPVDHNRALVRFSITDTGPGIPEGSLESLFQPFTQLDSAGLLQGASGTGLGLSVCKRLVELLGGRIGAQSTLGKGSEFWFELPLHLQTEPTGNIPALPDSGGAVLLALSPSRATLDMFEQHALRLGIAAHATQEVDLAVAQLQQIADSGLPLLALMADLDLPSPQLEQLHLLASDLFGAPPHLLLLARPRAVVPQALLSVPHTTLGKPFRRMQLARSLAVLLERTTAGHAPRIQSETDPGLRTITPFPVLVVEDNYANQRVAEGLLKRLGLSCDVAANGAEALALLARNRYRMVFMDCQMPVMDGYETTRRIRSGPDPVLDRHIPVVAMTAHAYNEEREACLASGMDDHLAKPVRFEELERVIRRWARSLGDTPRQRSSNFGDTSRPGQRPTFDRKDLEDRLMSDWRLIRKVASACLRELKTHFTALEQSLAESNTQACVLHSHSMKGVAATLGAAQVNERAAQMESLAKAGKLLEIEPLLLDMQRLLDELEPQVATFLERVPE